MKDKKAREIKKNVEKHYDKRVSQFSDEMLALKEKRMRPLYEKVLEFAEINQQTIVGIIGSSTGSMPLFLAPRVKRVIGVDLSKESLSFAEKRTRQLGVRNIVYKKGDAEAVPLKDGSVDVVFSDCVINLVPDKQKAINEIYRILKADGSLVMADPVRIRQLKETSDELLTGCIAGTVAKEDYRRILEKAGFESIEIADITDLAKKVFEGHEEKFDKYGLDYVIIKAIKPAKSTKRPKDEKIRQSVREGYARIVKMEDSCCGGPGLAKDISKNIGYTEDDLKAVPEGANLGLGCGNPIALASLKQGEGVLDLGSGAGFDCFLAGDRVGEKGRVIGVDMTPEMVEKARENARKGNYKNVEFRLGEIENLPVADSSVDIVISNCVINLSQDKKRVFKEAFRVLKPGGRLMVSDIVLLKELPDFLKESIEAYVGCLAGAMMRDEYLETIKSAGFEDVKIVDKISFPAEYMANDPIAQAIIENFKIPSKNAKEAVKEFSSSIISIKIYGVKPNEKL